jgi:hypothetical protein
MTAFAAASRVFRETPRPDDRDHRRLLGQGRRHHLVQVVTMNLPPSPRHRHHLADPGHGAQTCG